MTTLQQINNEKKMLVEMLYEPSEVAKYTLFTKQYPALSLAIWKALGAIDQQAP